MTFPFMTSCPKFQRSERTVGLGQQSAASKPASGITGATPWNTPAKVSPPSSQRAF
jgi:hypothetical protein